MDETLEHACQRATDQIRDKRYEEGLLVEGCRTVICYGIAFKGKDCRIEAAE